MGWEDRQYYRDRSRPIASGILAVLNGSVPLFTAFGIRVRAHASLIILIVAVILLDIRNGYPLQERALSMGVLGLMILLHEFGHCFAARWVGGEANDVLLWPLGGLAFAHPPHRPLPTFITVAAGPSVNVLICLICAATIWMLGGGMVSLNPFNMGEHPQALIHLFNNHYAAFSVALFLLWAYWMSYALFLFNLLPIFPLDGGQMFQSILWPRIGYYRSMTIACMVGMVGAGVLGLLGIVRGLDLLLICIAISCFFYCRMRWIELKEMGPNEYAMEDGMDFSASLAPDRPGRRRRHMGRWTARRLRRQSQEEEMLQTRIDAILAKVSAHGMHSLTWSERRTLRKATERQRRLELSRK